MSFANFHRKALDYSRSVPGKIEPELRQYRIFKLNIQWTGDRVGKGSEIRTETELTSMDGVPYKVRQFSTKEVANSNGVLSNEDLSCKFTQPYDADKGYSIQDLMPEEASETQSQDLFKITSPLHPNGAIYKVISRSVKSMGTIEIVFRKTGSQNV